jgi:hypothetical protein
MMYLDLIRRLQGFGWRTILQVTIIFLPILLSAQIADEELRRNIYRDLAQLSSYEGLPYYAVNQQALVMAEGTGLLNEEWQEGALVAPNDSTYRFKGRYNVLADEFQVLVNGRVRALYPNVVKGVELDEKIFLPVDYVAKNKRGKAFFEVLYFGNTSLLLRRKAAVKATEIHPVLGTSVSNDSKVVFEKSFYYQRPGLPARLFKNKRKHVLELFGDRRKEMEAFLKKEKLNPRRQEDLIRLFEYYNKLMN